MDSIEATEIVYSRIQALDPENASKITGYVLIQEHGEKEMIRLAFGPQTLLHSLILHAKTQLGIISSSSSPPPYLSLTDHLPWRPCLYDFKGLDFCMCDSPRCEEEMQRLGWLTERSELYGINCSSSVASRQIYLTFPAHSTFREEDVSNYFSIYGPVYDVRIPYQEKRMFGFVTFIFPETVRLILAKGNPHFVCESRVLVKPYKEKGRTTDKNRLIPTIDTLLPPPPHHSHIEEKLTLHHVFGLHAGGGQFANRPLTDGGEETVRPHFRRTNTSSLDQRHKLSTGGGDDLCCGHAEEYPFLENLYLDDRCDVEEEVLPESLYVSPENRQRERENHHGVCSEVKPI